MNSIVQSTPDPNYPLSPNCNGGNNNVLSAFYDYNGSTGSNNYVYFTQSQGSGSGASNHTGNTTNNLFKIDANTLNTSMNASGVLVQYICLGIDPDLSGTFTNGANDVTTLEINGGTTGTATNGIKNINNNKLFQVLPNPFSNQLTINNINQTVVSQISIVDVLGREVLTLNPDQTSSFAINTQSLENGIYFVKVYNNNDIYTVKLIKE